MAELRDLTLEHYSSEPVSLYKRHYRQERLMPHAKPHGLWVSVKGEDDWHSWCTAEEFHNEGLNVRHAVELREGARIRLIQSVDEIDSFHAEFAKRWCDESWARSYGLDWREVAEHYQGVIIAPYIWQRRLDKPVSDWYYGWDCASGCIWDLSAIERFEVAEIRKQAA